MPTTIEVNKQSVETLLGSGKSKPFVIPEYQRSYAWSDEQVETLFEDYGNLQPPVVVPSGTVHIFLAALSHTRTKTASKRLSMDSSVLHRYSFCSEQYTQN